MGESLPAARKRFLDQGIIDETFLRQLELDHSEKQTFDIFFASCKEHYLALEKYLRPYSSIDYDAVLRILLRAQEDFEWIGARKMNTLIRMISYCQEKNSIGVRWCYTKVKSEFISFKEAVTSYMKVMVRSECESFVSRLVNEVVLESGILLYLQDSAENANMDLPCYLSSSLSLVHEEINTWKDIIVNAAEDNDGGHGGDNDGGNEEGGDIEEDLYDSILLLADSCARLGAIQVTWALTELHQICIHADFERVPEMVERVRQEFVYFHCCFHQYIEYQRELLRYDRWPA